MKNVKVDVVAWTVVLETLNRKCGRIVTPVSDDCNSLTATIRKQGAKAVARHIVGRDDYMEAAI